MLVMGVVRSAMAQRVLGVSRLSTTVCARVYRRRMLETTDEIDALQALLDASHARATGHLRGIIDDDRTLTAEQLVALLTGMKVLSVATVTARGEPRISALDGHFLHGTWTFSTERQLGQGATPRAPAGHQRGAHRR